MYLVHGKEQKTLRATLGNQQKKRQEVLGNHLRISLALVQMAKKLPSQNWSGGYTGNGGKYEPMGIVHGGEYVMTKEATSRLGVNTLNALNYGKRALIAGGLGISVATAAPVQVDTRAPIFCSSMMTQTSQPMSVNITINAAQGMDERAIAQQVAKQIQRIENQRQARARSSMWDRA